MVLLVRLVILFFVFMVLMVLWLVRWYLGFENYEFDFVLFLNFVELVIVFEVYLNGYWKFCVLGLGVLMKLKKLVLWYLLIVGLLFGMERLMNLEELVLRLFCLKNMSFLELDCFLNFCYFFVFGIDI